MVSSNLIYLLAILTSFLYFQLVIATPSFNSEESNFGLLSDDSSISNSESDEENALMRRSATFLRFGRQLPSSSATFLRFGRSQPTFLRFGRAAPGQFLRFGRRYQQPSANQFLRFGRKGEFLRFG